MSRSYKKHPVAPDGVGYKSKKLANRKVRRSVDVLKGNGYKKIYESWDIHDYKDYGDSFETFYRKAVEYWEKTGYWWGRERHHRKDTPPTREYCMNIYNRWYRRK